MWRWIVTVGAITLTSATIVGCSQDSGATDRTPSLPQTVVTEDSQDGPARPTLTEERLQPPPQQNEYSTAGRPEVVFDPCTWISDDAIVAAGLDPKTRRRGRDWIAEYVFLTCDFEGELRELQVNSGNVTWEENSQKNGAFSAPIKIGAREALLVQDPNVRESCSIHVRTKAGFVMFSSVRTLEGSRSGLGRCDGVVEIATALEPEIGSEN